MKYNPFRPNSIVSPGIFSGRVDELNAVEKSLFQTKHGNPHHFLFQGERGIGKSSLLFFVELVASGQIDGIQGEKFDFLTISIELSGADDYFDIVKKIAAGLKSAIGERKTVTQFATKTWEFLSNWEVMGVKYNKDSSNLQPTELLDGLTQSITSLLADPSVQLDGLLILIDEADKPTEDSNLGELLKTLTERLSKRRCENVLIGLAGLPSLVGKLKASHESAPRVFETMSLKTLDDGQSAEIINLALEEANEKNSEPTIITQNALDLVIHLSEGYPHFIQQFGYCAFDCDNDNNIDRADVTNGAHRANGALYQLGSKFFNDMYYATSSDDYRTVLNTFAIHGDDWVARATIIEETGFAEHTVTNALKALRDRNVILPKEGQKGSYRLPTRSFAAWINAMRAIEETADEDSPQLPLERE